MKTVFGLSCIVCLVAVSVATNSHFLRDLRARQSQGGQCQAMDRCLWILCRWTRRMIIDYRHCQFIPTGCGQCPEGTRCRRTDFIKPLPGNHIVYDYRCQPHHRNSHRPAN